MLVPGKVPSHLQSANPISCRAFPLSAHTAPKNTRGKSTRCPSTVQFRAAEMGGCAHRAQLPAREMGDPPMTIGIARPFNGHKARVRPFRRAEIGRCACHYWQYAAWKWARQRRNWARPARKCSFRNRKLTWTPGILGAGRAPCGHWHMHYWALRLPRLGVPTPGNGQVPPGYCTVARALLGECTRSNGEHGPCQ